MARFATTEAEVRAALAAQLNLDEATSLQERVLVADICSVWNDAQRQFTKESELRAEARTSGHREPPQPRDVKSMRSAFIGIYGKIEPEHTPGRYLVGLKLDELSENDPQIEQLFEVSEKGDGEEEILIPELTLNNQLKVRKGVAPKGKEPKDPEELRVKYELICNAWLFAKTRYGSREWLRFLTRGSYDCLCKYIFGPKVMRIESAPVGQSATPIHPSWTLVLHYQQEIRKKAYEYVREDGTELTVAITKAIKDEETRALHFTAPFAQEVATFRDKRSLPPAPNLGFGEGGRRLPWIREGTTEPAGKSGKKAKGAKSGKGGKSGNLLFQRKPASSGFHRRPPHKIAAVSRSRPPPHAALPLTPRMGDESRP